MIIDEKFTMQPLPPYLAAAGPPPFPGRRSGPPANLDSLPPHLLLQVVYSTFPQTDLVDQAKPERQRKTLYWLATSLRLVSRALYVACMHVLRSTYLPAYDSLIRPPYSSDPFPLLSPAPPPPSPYAPSSSSLSLSRAQPFYDSLQTIQRETATLDLFIALKVREDVWADDSELHLERDESFKDLFYLRQPRSRLEDLVRVYGIREGIVTTTPPASRRATAASTSRRTPTPPTPATPPPPPTPTSFFASLSSSFSKQKQKLKTPPSPAPAPSSPRKIRPIQFAAISVSFSPRKVGIVLDTAGKRTVVETARARDEKLESAAKRLVKELKVWLVESAG